MFYIFIDLSKEEHDCVKVQWNSDWMPQTNKIKNLKVLIVGKILTNTLFPEEIRLWAIK